MNIDNFKKICVVGFGRSGASLVKSLLSIGKKIKVTDQKEASAFSPYIINKFKDWGVEFEFGIHTPGFIKDSDLLVLSPGVDINKSSVSGIAKEYGLLAVGEIELASWLTSSKIVAITGTNGKTTTTFLTYRVLKSKRKNVYLAGNIGIPFSSYVLDTRPKDIIVLEISSFQLENIIEFKPFIACFLNIEPDHLDRYSNFSQYLEAKKNIFRNQDENDWAVLSRDSAQINHIAKDVKSKIVHFSSELGNANYSAVYRIASIFGLSKIDCMKVFSEFKGLPHRLQFVRRVGGVAFINDSKATNPASTVWALENVKSPIILIAGGKDKGLDYSSIRSHLGKVKKINLFGNSASKIKDALGDSVRTEIFSTLCDAVTCSFSDAQVKGTVLFSPMCSSFDMFSNYVERGRRFIEIVNNL